MLATLKAVLFSIGFLVVVIEKDKKIPPFINNYFKILMEAPVCNYFKLIIKECWYLFVILDHKNYYVSPVCKLFGYPT